MKDRHYLLSIAVAFALLAASPTIGRAAPEPARPATRVEFNRDVRPILSDTCFKCHGFDPASRKADLRLDVREAAISPRNGKAGGVVPIVPGDPAKSAIWERIVTDDPGELMPPPDSHLVLSTEQKKTIRLWIEQGAEYQPHWAFVPVKTPAVPAVDPAARARNEIDAFVLNRLKSEGISPTSEADKPTLIRRVTFDLTGLPPTAAEVATFVNDSSPDAYDKLVDRLLASPAYGERMASDWLDASRYADTHGFNNDSYRSMWRYRDWVIDAFNSNKHYDTFLTEQLAGDLLPDATLDQKIASGFNRNHVANSEGGIIEEEYRVEYVADRTSTAGTVFLGLTLQCARCHDHKYDPLTQKEFFQLFAFFNQLQEKGQVSATADADPVVKAPTVEQQKTLAAVADEISGLESVRKSRVASAEASRTAWEPTLAGPVAALPKRSVDKLLVNLSFDRPTPPDLRASPRGGGAALDGADGIELGKHAGDFDRTDAFSYGAWVLPASADTAAVLSKMDTAAANRGYDLLVGGGKIEAHVIHAWPDDALRVETKTPLEPGKWHHVFVTYDGSGKAAGLKVYADGQLVETIATKDSLTGTIKSAAPLAVGRRGGGLKLKGQLDDLRVYGRALSADEVKTLGERVPLAEAPATKPEARSPEQAATLLDFYLRTADPAYGDATTKIDAARKREAEINAAVPTTMVMADMSPPRQTFVLNRGEYDAPGEPVQPGTPKALPPFPAGAPANRLGLAMWLTDPAHPLTARVAVNRFWYQYFGVGLVKTMEDFGLQGEQPSNPELLDWLASQFVQSGWDVKALQRLIVTSRTYRQATRYDAELLERDPENRLLARGPRMRLPAEMIRDNALSLAGVLVNKIGGPSVMPYQPPGLWEDVVVGANYPGTVYTQGHGEDLYRRSMYTFWKRTAPPPALNSFDAPEREFCTIRRPMTNTPLQALVLLNDPTYTEAARKIAERMMTEGGTTPADRIGFAFKLAAARAPTAEEAKVLTDTFARCLARYQAEPGEAAKLLKAGDSPRDPKLNAGELAAYTTVASMLLNLDETITK